MKKLPAVRLAEREDVAQLPDLPEQVRLAMTRVVTAGREGLLAMSVAVGLRVMSKLQAELAAKVGPKARHDPDRTADRDDTAPGSVVLGGRRVPVQRPRAAPVTATRCSWTSTPPSPVDATLARAFANPDPDAGPRAARDLAHAL